MTFERVKLCSEKCKYMWKVYIYGKVYNVYYTYMKSAHIYVYGKVYIYEMWKLYIYGN